ncbi:hypothetical protein VP01_3093g1 [Puccinia sorghi]|uniref:Uncharacterized protein n=1 Tax=Puccinia sorghi TaxID=27349 RepID=A0A0L6V0C9_9BASI|nr:hypothetical protein VP01_3093g1 [Puccinia sorghi]
MFSCESTETSTIHLSDFQGLRRRSRSSFLAGRMESLKLTVLTRGKKAEYGIEKVEEVEEKEEGSDPKTSRNMSKPLFEVILPQQEPQAGDERFHRSPRRFPADWQTSLSPPGTVLRGNTIADRKVGSGALGHRTIRMWPVFGSECKFFRFIVVASPSLQRLVSTPR